MSEDSDALLAPSSAPLQLTAEEKAQWAERFLESGLSIRKFSAQHKLPLMSLWRWVNKAKANQATTAGAVEVHRQLPAFREIKLITSRQPSVWVAELSWPNGKVLRLSADVPAAMLEQLLRVC